MLKQILEKYDKVEGPLATFNSNLEEKVQKVCLKLIYNKIINSAHDLSDGGLAITLSESVITSKDNLGASVVVEGKMREDENFIW